MKLITVAVPCAITKATGTPQGSPSNLAAKMWLIPTWTTNVSAYSATTAAKRALLGGAWKVHRRLIR